MLPLSRCRLPLPARAVSVASPQLLLLVLALLCLPAPTVTAQSSGVSTNTVSTSVWLSGPLPMWVAVMQDDADTFSTNFKDDMLTTLAACDTVSLFSLLVGSPVPYTNVTSGPATGLHVPLTVVDTILTPEEVTACVRRSPLGNLKKLAQLYDFFVFVIPAASPAELTHRVTGLMRVNGAAQWWSLLYNALASQSDYDQTAFMVTYEFDVQTAVDTAVTDYLVVAHNLSACVANSTAFYFSYGIWSLPSARPPAASDAAGLSVYDLQALAESTPLTLFNRFFDSDESIQPYRRYFPRPIAVRVQYKTTTTTSTTTTTTTTTTTAAPPPTVTTHAPITGDCVNTSVWLSGPAAVWDGVFATSVSSASALAALLADLTAAAQACNSDAVIAFLSPVSYSGVETGPSTGVGFTFAVCNADWTETQVDACLGQAAFTHLNDDFLQAMPSFLSFTTALLPASSPADTTMAQEVTLPLTGHPNAWATLLHEQATRDRSAQQSFLYALQSDLQAALRHVTSTHLAVVSSSLADVLVNASGVYVSCSLWRVTASPAASSSSASAASPSRRPLITLRPVPALVSDVDRTVTAAVGGGDENKEGEGGEEEEASGELLVAALFASPLTVFNTYLNSTFVSSSSSSIAYYRRFLPAAVLPRRPGAADEASLVASVWLSGPAVVWQRKGWKLQAPLAADVLSAVSDPSLVAPSLSLSSLRSDGDRHNNNNDDGGDGSGATAASPGQSLVSSQSPLSAFVVNWTAYSEVLDRPATGALVYYQVSSSHLTATDMDARVRAAAALPSVNAALAAAASSSPSSTTLYIPWALRVVPMPPSTEMTLVVDALLPVSGSSYAWQLVLQAVNKLDEEGRAAFFHALQTDIQDAVDADMTQYVAVVPTDVAASFANASSVYFSYAIWDTPSAAPAGVVVRDALRTQVMASQLPAFNSAYRVLVGQSTNDTSSLLASIRDLLPVVVLPWEPPVAASLPSSSSTVDDEDSDQLALREEVGDYLLVFGGDATTWGSVWAAQPAAVSAAVVAAAQARLARRTVPSSVAVLSAETVANERWLVGGLQVRCRVVQGVTRISDHIWTPVEVASLLRTTNYTAMQALYSTAAATTQREVSTAAFVAAVPGNIATSGIDYDYRRPLAHNVIGIICMCVIIVVSCLLVVLMAVLAVCYCRWWLVWLFGVSTRSLRGSSGSSSRSGTVTHDGVSSEERSESTSRYASSSGTSFTDTSKAYGSGAQTASSGFSSVLSHPYRQSTQSSSSSSTSTSTSSSAETSSTERCSRNPLMRHPTIG